MRRRGCALGWEETNMERYEKLEIEVVEFESEDVIATSDCFDHICDEKTPEGQ